MAKVNARGLAAEQDDWTMPRVEVGQVVLWRYTKGDPRSSPALVLAVGNGTLNLAVHVDGVHDHVLKTGVRHAGDPFLDAHPLHDSGVWHSTMRDIQLDALLDRLRED